MNFVDARKPAKNMPPLQVGDRISFLRGKERAEGYCTVLGIDPATKNVQLSPIPEGIEPGDLMLIESEASIDTLKEALGIKKAVKPL